MDGNKLPRTAYELKEGEKYVPLTHGKTLAEFTIKAVITGAVLGVVFGAANTYLGLKAGQLFGIIRVATTGKKVAPPLFGTLAILGQDRVLERMDAAERVLAPLAEA